MKALRLLLATVAALAAGLLGLAALYLAVAVVSALLPLGGRVQQTAASDPPAHVCATLTHTDIVLPARDGLIDWTAVFPDGVPVGFVPNLHVAFGWGDLTFYRETPSWADLRFSTAMAALFGGGPSALHVAYVLDPAGVPGCVRLVRLQIEVAVQIVDGATSFGIFLKIADIVTFNGPSSNKG
jgi:uncharacterized membrane protein YuzA (DUF378 family)